MGNETARNGSLYSAAYGSHQLVSVNNITIVEKSYGCATSEERNSLIGLVSLLKQLEIPTLLHIQNVANEPGRDIVIHFEHCPVTLADDIATKKLTYFRYTEPDLYGFVDCILSGLMALSFKNLNHRDLWPGSILLGQLVENSKHRLFKIGYPVLMNPRTVEKAYSGMSQHQRQEQVYFGPQMFEAVNRLANRSYSLEKSDVYSLGLIALEMATLEPVWSVYNHQTGQINQLEVDKLLRICGQRYSQQLTALLRDMLINDDANRPNFQEVFAVLEPLLEMSNQSEEHYPGKEGSPIAPPSSSEEHPAAKQPGVTTSVNNFPPLQQRKIQVTSNRRLRVTSKPHQEPLHVSQQSNSLLAGSRKSIHSSRRSAAQLPTFCWVTQPSFLAQLHVRRPIDSTATMTT